MDFMDQSLAGKINSLEGTIKDLAKVVKSQSKKINKLEKEMIDFRGLKGLASCLR